MTVEEWLTPQDVAHKLRLAVGTLANWRVSGEGPAYVKVGRLVRYPASALSEWQDGLK